MPWVTYYFNQAFIGLIDWGDESTSPELSNLPEGLLGQIQSIVGVVGDDIITSLLYPDPKVTVEEATKNFGQRYGFYQQKINED